LQALSDSFSIALFFQIPRPFSSPKSTFKTFCRLFWTKRLLGQSLHSSQRTPPFGNTKPPGKCHLKAYRLFFLHRILFSETAIREMQPTFFCQYQNTFLSFISALSPPRAFNLCVHKFRNGLLVLGPPTATEKKCLKKCEQKAEKNK